MNIKILILAHLSQVAALSGLSSFFGTRHTYRATQSTNSLVMYENAHDPPNNKHFNAWTVLSNTEAWLSKTLETANSDNGGANPYTRKEVSYQCETATTGPMLAANLFRRLKEARELGQAHGAEQSQLDRTDPPTLRQTTCIVIPGLLVDNFPAFDRFVKAMNQSRRNSRDYVTAAVDDEEDDDDEELPWSVAVNCAHLHPQFGEKTPLQKLQELKEEEEEVDVNYQEYLRKKNLARQSPYPTIVIEVRATPPPDFGQQPIPPPATASNDEKSVTAADIRQLEALFGRSAHLKDDTYSEDDFFNAVNQSINPPLQAAQEWIATNDPNVQLTAAFTESTTTQVDEAYEFLFTNVAMMMEDKVDESHHRKYYLLLPHFLPNAATSLEKFVMEAEFMLQALPDTSKVVSLATFHPEHIDPFKRAPYPMIAMEWKAKS